MMDHYVRAADGLWLHAAEWGPGRGFAVPVVCLPGLARTARDFAELGEALTAMAPARRVLALDYRGRGRSDYDPNAANYSFPVEARDILTTLSALGIDRAIVIGTSRGGIHAMGLAAMKPGLVAGAVLNDIGPVVETAGLVRIQGYIGKTPPVPSFEIGAAILAKVGASQFPRLDAAGWLRMAHLLWKEEAAGKLVLDYDPALSTTVEQVSPDMPNPTFWEAFAALSPVRVLSIRGSLSDILLAATVDEMARRHPRLEVLTVPDEGHAPLLADIATITRISDFVQSVPA
jgi:pimeloyl-ACP methyl ester carboxylesterase